MKALLRVSVLTLVATIAVAQTDSKPASTSKTSSRPAASAKEVQDLRDALAAQQQQMEAQRQQVDQLKSQLQQLLDATQQANAAAQKGQSSADQAQSTAAQAQQSATEAQRLADQASSSAVEAKTALSLVDSRTQDRTSASAPYRTCCPPPFQRRRPDPGREFHPIWYSGPQPRAHPRPLWLRWQIERKFTAGIYLATGSLADPTTTNETFTNFFDRKTIGLDRAFYHLQPDSAQLALSHRR